MAFDVDHASREEVEAYVRTGIRQERQRARTKKIVLIVAGSLAVVCGVWRCSEVDKVSAPVHTAPAVASTPVAEATRENPSRTVAQPVAVSETETAIQFGKPTVSSSYGMTTVKVMARNTSGRTLNCMLTGTFLRGDTILGTANGAVNDIPPGSTKTAQLITMDKVKGYDTLKLEQSTCF